MAGLDAILDTISLADLGEPEPNEKEVSSYQPSNPHGSGVTSSIEQRALELLGNGVPQEATASALGISPSRITQLLSNAEFAAAVSELRFKQLQKHNARDGKYDSIEDKLLEKLEKSLPLLLRPQDILKAITVVNGAKRRGHDAPASGSGNQTIVNVILPKVVTEAFTVDINNQVTKAGEQELLTMSSGNLKKKVEETRACIEHKPSAD